MKKLIIISALLFAILSISVAQERRGPSPEMFEKIKSEKISFFTGKLDLTPAEAQAFWPVYNEFDKKRFELQRQIHEFERMPEEKYKTLSESEIEKMTNNYLASFETEANLIKEYHQKFLKVLPKKKVLMIYRTENEFRSYLIREYKRGPKKE
ncbi:MAG: hypothetical protein JNK09_10100 [Prolixibacteraceae bacterium]|nr:hypothetical protein [Prolixibacteraceae bacterium]